MIKGADEFKSLREGENQEEYSRAATDDGILGGSE